MKFKDDVIIVCHNNCVDGFTSRYIAELGLIEQGYDKNNITAVGVDHDITVFFSTTRESSEGYLNIRDFKDKIVVVVDFTFDVKITGEIIDICSKYMLFDHHTASKKIVKEYLNRSDKFTSVVDMERCGCEIVQRYFFPDEPEPKILKYIADIDLDKGLYESSLDIHVYLTSIDKSIYNWETVIEFEGSALKSYVVAKGQEVRRYNKKIIMEAIKRSSRLGTIKGTGIRLPIVNLPSSLTQEAIPLLLEYWNSKGNRFSTGLTYFMNRKDEYSCSVRSLNGEALFIAELFEGGGRDNSAGFRSSIVPVTIM